MAGTDFPPLRTRRLVLRDVGDGDFSTLLRLRTDPDISRFVDWPETELSTEAWVRNLIAEMQTKTLGADPGWYQLAVEEQADGRMVGDLGIGIGVPGPRQAEIGSRVLPEFQRQGLAREALEAIIGHLFDAYDLHRITALVAVENVASVALLERLGFRREGHFRRSFWKDGRWLDDYAFAMLAEDWQARGIAK